MGQESAAESSPPQVMTLKEFSREFRKFQGRQLSEAEEGEIDALGCKGIASVVAYGRDAPKHREGPLQKEGFAEFERAERAADALQVALDSSNGPKRYAVIIGLRFWSNQRPEKPVNAELYPPEPWDHPPAPAAFLPNDKGIIDMSGYGQRARNDTMIAMDWGVYEPTSDTVLHADDANSGNVLRSTREQFESEYPANFDRTVWFVLPSPFYNPARQKPTVTP